MIGEGVEPPQPKRQSYNLVDSPMSALPCARFDSQTGSELGEAVLICVFGTAQHVVVDFVTTLFAQTSITKLDVAHAYQFTGLLGQSSL